MADATTAARARIDRALAELERKILELKARPASAPAIGDDDLFAPRSGNGPDAARVAELEQRLSRLNLEAASASGNASRAEGLLVAFAVRRALDRGHHVEL